MCEYNNLKTQIQCFKSSSIQQKRQQFHFQLRKKRIEQLFIQKRIVIARQNKNSTIIVEIVGTIINSLPARQEIVEQHLELLRKSVQVIEKNLVCQFSSEFIADFLYFLGVALEKYEQSTSQLPKTIAFIASLVQQLLNRIENGQYVTFFSKIYSVTHSGIFIELHKNIHKRDYPCEIKQELFKSFMFLLMNKKQYFFQNRLTLLLAIQEAIVSSSSCIIQSTLILQNIDNLYHLIVISNQEGFQRQIAAIFRIIQLVILYKKGYIFSFKNLSDLIALKITTQQNQAVCIDIITAAVSHESFNFFEYLDIVNSIKSIAEYISDSYKQSYNNWEIQIIKSLIYFFNNFVCCSEGARYFKQNKLSQCTTKILEKCQSDSQISRLMAFLFTNFIYFLLQNSVEQQTVIQVLENEKYQKFLYSAVQNTANESLALQIILKSFTIQGLHPLLIVRDQSIQKVFYEKYQSLSNESDIQLMSQILSQCQKQTKGLQLTDF